MFVFSNFETTGSKAQLAKSQSRLFYYWCSGGQCARVTVFHGTIKSKEVCEDVYCIQKLFELFNLIISYFRFGFPSQCTQKA